jgi:cytoplasmic iron level regulating protein YaaA (DUF328/UPF0246 family)
MGISDDLAKLNKTRFKVFQEAPSQELTKQAALTFAGDTYRGLDANSFSEENLKFAQQNIRILSGLYGVLRPLDLIQPYRLEMGANFSTPNSKNLYTFWKNKITRSLSNELMDHKFQKIINLASVEYFKAVDSKVFNEQIITPKFLEKRGSDYKNISFYSKYARGAMARFIIKNQIEDPKNLKDFNQDGYCYEKSLSTPENPFFLQRELNKC